MQKEKGEVRERKMKNGEWYEVKNRDVKSEWNEGRKKWRFRQERNREVRGRKKKNGEGYEVKNEDVKDERNEGRKKRWKGDLGKKETEK